MVLLLDTPAQVIPSKAHPENGPCVSYNATVLNWQALEEQCALEEHSTLGFILHFVREDHGKWRVQGNQLVVWDVEGS
jgi:hypothetical protein